MEGHLSDSGDQGHSAESGAGGRAPRRRDVRRAIQKAGRRYHLELNVGLTGFPSNTKRAEVQLASDGIVHRAIRRSSPLTKVSSPQDADLLVRVTLQLTGLSAPYQTAQGVSVGKAISGVKARGRIEVYPTPVPAGGKLQPGTLPGYIKSFSGATDPPSTTSSRVFRSGPDIETAITRGLEPCLKALSRKLWR